MNRAAALLICACPWVFPAQGHAADILLNPPLDCDLASTCFIQQYMDRDPGPGAADFNCGLLSYNEHSGTDFALPSLAMQQAGVNVLAAAPGTVKAARDGMPDVLQGTPDAPSVAGKECGNGVVIDHGGGWETQYCHMKQGSIAVQKGQRVALGTVLGQVGLSGQTQFPHVHLSVRKDGTEIDPFHPDETLQCGAPPESTLWQDAVPYHPGGVISAGFATDVPEFGAVKQGLPSPATLPPDAPALVLWAYGFGSRVGDVMTLTLTGPSGEVLREAVTLTRDQAQFFRAAGKRTPAAGWPPGLYQGEITMTRGTDQIDSSSVAITVQP